MKMTGGGKIINISSRSGIVGVPVMCAYASSKAAVRNHTKSVALYCLKNNYGILCKAVVPKAAPVLFGAACFFTYFSDVSIK